MAWMYLTIAGFAEVIGVVFLKQSEGFSRWKPLLICLTAGVVSFYCLSLSLADIPIGTAYSIWTGIGSAGSVLIGMILYKEPKDIKRLAFLSLIIVGAIGLKFTTGH